MKILVLQLARLGDIYQTWPVLKALKRMHSDCEIHLATREKFKAAAPGSEWIDRHWCLDSRRVLSPLVDERPDIDLSMKRLAEFADGLRGEAFDRVINLSFSPFSSYLTREVAGSHTEVAGYTRFDDGSLCIPDDGSAYFYSQVGPGKSNRLHITDLFAHVAGVHLLPDDWNFNKCDQVSMDSLGARRSLDRWRIEGQPIVLHIGASEARKTLSWSKWVQVCRGLLDEQNRDVVLVGSQDETVIAEKVLSSLSGSRVPLNLVGKTSLDDLFEIVSSSALLVGGDSGPAQIASLTGTPVLNISFPTVSCWETGPRSAQSRIIVIGDESEIAAVEIVREARAILEGRPAVIAQMRAQGPTEPFLEIKPRGRRFEWEMIQAIYLGEPFPPPPREEFLEGVRHLADVNHLAIEQIAALRRRNNNTTAAAILERVDEIMDRISKLVPELEPLVAWFHTERLRIGPMPIDPLVESTHQVHERLGQVLELYFCSTGSASAEGDDAHDDVNLE